MLISSLYFTKPVASYLTAAVLREALYREDSTGSIPSPTLTWARTAFPKRPELIELTIKRTGLTHDQLLSCAYDHLGLFQTNII